MRAADDSRAPKPDQFAVQHVSQARMRQALALLGLGAGVSRPATGRYVLIEIARERTAQPAGGAGKVPAAQSPARSGELLAATRMAEIVAHATEALDGQVNAMQWLQQANRSLGGRSPLEVLAEAPAEDAERVDELFYGIEYGMYA